MPTSIKMWDEAFRSARLMVSSPSGTGRRCRWTASPSEAVIVVLHREEQRCPAEVFVVQDSEIVCRPPCAQLVEQVGVLGRIEVVDSVGGACRHQPIPDRVGGVSTRDGIRQLLFQSRGDGQLPGGGMNVRLHLLCGLLFGHGVAGHGIFS